MKMVISSLSHNSMWLTEICRHTLLQIKKRKLSYIPLQPILSWDAVFPTRLLLRQIQSLGLLCFPKRVKLNNILKLSSECNVPNIRILGVVGYLFYAVFHTTQQTLYLVMRTWFSRILATKHVITLKGLRHSTELRVSTTNNYCNYGLENNA